jgi:hypothetical protein
LKRFFFFTFVGSSTSESDVVWERCFQRQYPDLYKCLHSVREDRLPRRSWRAEFLRRHAIGSTVARLVGGMSARFHHISELSTDDFADFDDMLLVQNPDRGWDHLYLMDELLTMLHGQGRDKDRHFSYKNLTVKYYAAKVVRHVQHRLLRPKIEAFLEAVEVTDNVPSGNDRNGTSTSTLPSEARFSD